MYRLLLAACLCLTAGCATTHLSGLDGGSDLAQYGPLRPDQPVRIESTDLRLLEGTLAGSHGDTLFLRTGVDTQTVPVASIRQFWVRGRSTRQWGKWFAIPGVILGGLFGGFVAGMGGADAGEGRGAMIAGGVYGGLTFWCVGALLGSVTPRWELRFEASSEVPAAPKPAARLRPRRPPSTIGS
jgi:hypothetical protein